MMPASKLFLFELTPRQGNRGTGGLRVGSGSRARRETTEAKVQ